MNTFLLDYDQIEQRGFPKLFGTYVGENPERASFTSSFFQHDFQKEADYYKLLGTLSAGKYNRQVIRQILERQNRNFGVNQRHLQQLDTLESPRTFFVVTGQQPGLFSGPLYTVYKALSAIMVAEQQNALFQDHHFIPLFWIESDDHDFEESAKTSLFRGTAVEEIVLEPWQRLPQQMVSRTPMGKGILDCLAQLEELLPDSEFKNEVTAKLQEFYTPEATLESGFAKTMAWLLSDFPILFLTPGDPAFKQLATETFSKELASAPRSSLEVITQSSLLEQYGFSAQAKPRAVNLFYVTSQGQRQKIEQSGDEWFELSPGRQRYSRHQLMEMCQDHPERFSPNVVLRPIVQDSVLPVFAYIGGPGEISYLAQYKRVYEQFGVTMPFIMPRASFTLVEPGLRRTMDKVMQKAGRPGFSRRQMYTTTFRDLEMLKKNAVDGSSEEQYDSLFDASKADVRSRLQELEPVLAKLDQTLVQSLQGTMRQVEKSLETLQAKTQRANRRKHDDVIGQVERISAELFPGGSPQERSVNICHYLARYGTGLLGELAGVMQAHATDSHMVVEL